MPYKPHLNLVAPLPSVKVAMRALPESPKQPLLPSSPPQQNKVLSSACWSPQRLSGCRKAAEQVERVATGS